MIKTAAQIKVSFFSQLSLDLNAIFFPKILTNFMAVAGQSTDAAGHGKGKYALIRDPEVFQTGVYDKPLPFFGCGIGWFS